jgi:hypothetical protein
MPRKRIGLQLEKSTTAGSMVRTNVSNEQEYFAPGSSGQLLTIVSGVPTWQTITFPSEFEQYASHSARPATGASDVIYYCTAENDFSIWTGSAYVVVPTSPSFTVAGNSGTSQTIASGATLSVLASLGFTSVASATGNVTITPPAGTTTGNVMTWNGTAWASATPTTGTFTLAGDTGTSQTISNGDTLTIKGATNSGVVVTASATDTVSISLNEQKDTFAPTSGATTVTLSQTPIASTLDIYRNGDLQDLTTDYTVSGVTVTFLTSFGATSGGAYSENCVAKYRYA